MTAWLTFRMMKLMNAPLTPKIDLFKSLINPRKNIEYQEVALACDDFENNELVEFRPALVSGVDVDDTLGFSYSPVKHVRPTKLSLGQV